MSPGENFCPEGEISISYMNKRVDGFIFSHLKMIYLSDMLCKIELSYIGKIPILHGQKWEKKPVSGHPYLKKMFIYLK